MIFFKLIPSSRNSLILNSTSRVVKNPQPRVGILDLPYKLRLQIFYYLVILRRPIYWHSSIILRKMLLELILIYRTFTPEALKVFYRENTFLFKPYKSLHTASELCIFLPYLKIYPLIKYLDLTFISRIAGYCNMVIIAVYLCDFEYLGFSNLKLVKVVINLNQVRDF